MNIALVVHDLHKHGGHSLYTTILADALAQRHDVTVFANGCERPAEARWTFYPVRAWRTKALATVHTFPIGLRSLSARLAEFDIRHMQGYCGGHPNVVTAHICLAAYLNSLRNISTQSLISLRLMAAAERRFYHRYEGQIIAVSQKVARELKEFYEVRGPLSVIPHGVDTNRFASDKREHDRAPVRNELGIAEDSTLVLYIGDLTKSHTHLKAIAAAAPEVEFVIVTSSKQYHWSGSNVHIIPATSDPARYYAAADAFIFPSTYDAFGMVLLEAMASGLAVFSSDRAGAAELISSGKDGFVFPLDDWVEATAAGLRDRDSLAAVGAEGEKTARQYSWLTVVRQVEQVYFKVVAAESAYEQRAVPGNGYRYQQ
jgi:UDP-glucose:(heptosyl)LPS alpha-1,3-glucosyltransferase